MKKIKNKKGVISPLVITFILVIISLIAFTAILFWINSVNTERISKFGVPIEDICRGIDYGASMSKANILIENTGKFPLYSLNLLIIKNGKQITKSLRPLDGIIDINEKETIPLKVSDISGKIEKMTLVPIVLGTGTTTGDEKLYACNDKSKFLI